LCLSWQFFLASGLDSQLTIPQTYSTTKPNYPSLLNESCLHVSNLRYINRDAHYDFSLGIYGHGIKYIIVCRLELFLVSCLKKRMIREVIKESSISDFERALKKVASDKAVKSILVLSCEANKYQAKDLDILLQSIKKPIFGGVFPQIISDNEKMLKGGLILGFVQEAKLITVNVPELSPQREEQLLQYSQDVISAKTMFVFVDGFAEKIGAFIDDVFNIFGLEKNYIGGGAGSLEAMHSVPCLMSNQGLLQNKAMIIAFEMNSGLGVKHGWESISDPIHITESQANVIKTIDWEPAFEVYKKIVEKHSGQIFKEDNFFDIAKAYPFGMKKLNNEMVVRDPLMIINKNEIVCVGEVPENSIVNILNGNKESLIAAATEASKQAYDNYPQKEENKSLFVIDCISRVLFLDDQFQEELSAVYDHKYPLFGVLSIGEIANTGRSFLEFYNKTMVAAFIES